MPVFLHQDVPFHQVPRIKTRVLASGDRGTGETAVWEQWIDAEGHIPLHYHETEEILVILEGNVSLTIEDETSNVAGPATIVVPPRQVHGMRPLGDSRVHLLAIFPTAKPLIFSPNGSLRPLPWEDFAESDTPP